MDSEDEGGEDLFNNWMRGAQGLQYLQEGLCDFVGEKVQQCRDNTLLRIIKKLPPGAPQSCNECTSLNLSPEHCKTNKACKWSNCVQRFSTNCYGCKPKGRRKCPGDICSRFYDAIVNDHTFEDPLWKNTDPSTWCSDPLGWSYAKCFQTTIGPGTSPKEVDAANLLSIVINNLAIQSSVSNSSIYPYTSSPIQKARDIRNEIFHSPQLKIDETTLYSYLDTFIAVLQDPNYLINDVASKEAVDKLLQLKSNSMRISNGDQRLLIENRNKALNELDEKTAEGLRELDKKTMASLHKLKQDIAEIRSNVLSDIETSKTDASQTIACKASKALSDLGKVKTDARQSIAGQTRDTLTDIGKAERDAKQNIASQTSNTLSHLMKAETDAKQNIAGQTSNVLTDIGKATTDAKQNISGQKSDALTDIGKAETEAKQNIAGYTSDARESIDCQVSGVLSFINNAAVEINKATIEAKQNIAEHATEVLSEAKQDFAMHASAAISALDKAGIETKEDVLKGACAVQTDINKYGVQKFQKGFRRIKHIFNSPNSKVEETKLHKEITKTVSGLRNELFTFYKNTCNSLPLTPLFEEKQTPLLDFFVKPTLYSIHFQMSESENETKTPVNSLSELFKTHNTTNREIYLTADAGFGKTAFSKYLAIAWCQSYLHDRRYIAYFDKGDIECMHEFDLLFLVSLRDCSDGCAIDDLIHNHVIQELSRYCTLSKETLREILHRTKHLIILDGLDEWTHPENKCIREPKSIPHRNKREECTILTTSRSWKLGILSLNCCQIDKKIELTKLSKMAAQLLEKRVISKIKDLDLSKTNDLVKSFQRQIKEAELHDIETNPLLLLYILCLWCEEKQIGKSRSDLYRNITELLLSRMDRKHGKHLRCCEMPDTYVPEFFNNHFFCCRYYTLVLSLGKLALHTLLCEKRENTLVFDEKIAEQFLSYREKQLCLISGLLTESKVKTLINESSKFSFSHKTVQEFFSAIYASFQNTKDVQGDILVHCNSLKTVLDMSTVFVFISKMNPILMSSISKDLVPVINNDEITRQLRTTTRYKSKYDDPLEDIQNMYMACSKECYKNNELKVCLEDFFLDEKCQQENYFKQLQHLCHQNKDKIKSITIRNRGICSLREIISSLQLSDLQEIEKLFYRGHIEKEDMVSLLLDPLKCISIIPSQWKDNALQVKEFLLSSNFNKRLMELNHLTCLNIGWLTMPHEVMGSLLNILTSKHSMKDITLFGIFCSDNHTCGGFSIDLSQHSYLKCLGLSNIPVSQLNINVSSLEECDVGYLNIPGMMASYLKQLPAASKLHTLSCFRLEFERDVDAMLQNLPLLVNLKNVKLSGINLGEKLVTLSPEMKYIEMVYLSRVTMSFLALKDIVHAMDKLPHSVTVCLANCNVKPEKEFENFKILVKDSDVYVVIFDNYFQDGSCEFMMKTIKY